MDLDQKWTGEDIRTLRKKHKLTQAEFAEIIGCRPQTISEWELGLYEPKNAYQQLLDVVQVRLETRSPLIQPSQRTQ